MAERNRATEGIDDGWVQFGPLAQTSQGLRSEGFVQLDDREVVPTHASTSESEPRCHDRSYAVKLRFNCTHATSRDPRERYTSASVESLIVDHQEHGRPIVHR
jgi:hypothetical protein